MKLKHQDKDKDKDKGKLKMAVDKIIQCFTDAHGPVKSLHIHEWSWTRFDFAEKFNFFNDLEEKSFFSQINAYCDFKKTDGKLAKIYSFSFEVTRVW